jgi:hypothetical protein
MVKQTRKALTRLTVKAKADLASEGRKVILSS